LAISAKSGASRARGFAFAESRHDRVRIVKVALQAVVLVAGVATQSGRSRYGAGSHPVSEHVEGAEDLKQLAVRNGRQLESGRDRREDSELHRD
jgi:hypothetical protein